MWLIRDVGFDLERNDSSGEPTIFRINRRIMFIPRQSSD
jgi:hypothetical protein